MTGARKKAINFIKNQAGFSLVELIIVIAVAGILAGTSVSLMGHIHFANTQKVVESIDTELSKQQIQAMSKSNKPYIYIYELDGSYYMRTLSNNITSFDSSVFTTSGVKLSNKSNKIYISKDGGTEMLVSGSDFAKIVYNRAGSFTSETNLDLIRVVGKGSHTIKLVEETGKHIVK